MQAKLWWVVREVSDGRMESFGPFHSRDDAAEWIDANLNAEDAERADNGEYGNSPRDWRIVQSEQDPAD